MDNKAEGMIVLYQTDNDKVVINVHFEDETFWLPQKVIAELFDTTVPNINIHIKNVIEEEELTEEATIKDSLIVQTEGNRQVNRPIKLYKRWQG